MVFRVESRQAHLGGGGGSLRVEPAVVALWGLGAGIVYGGIGGVVDRGQRDGVWGRAHDLYVLAWYGLSASGFFAAGFGAAVGGGVGDVALLSTLRLALVLTFVLAAASLLAAGAMVLFRPRVAVAG